MKFIDLDSIDSTTTYIKNNLSTMEDLTFVSASFQKEGHGRNNRVWLSNKNENLLFSVLIYNKDIIENFKKLSLALAATILKVLKTYNIDDVYIKWPNDVFVKDKKICGILLNGQLPNYLIAGVGINVNQTEFPNDLLISATSLKNELNKNIDLIKFKNDVYNEIGYLLNNFNEIIDQYIDTAIKFDYLKGKTRIINNQKVDVIGIQKDCSLSVISNGKKTNLYSGEVENE